MGAGVDLAAVCPPLEAPVYFKSFKVGMKKNKWDDGTHRSEWRDETEKT